MGNVRPSDGGDNPIAQVREQTNLPEIPGELGNADYALENARRESLAAEAETRARERRRARDRTNPRQVSLCGVLNPDEGYRRQSAGGSFVSWRQLDLELDRIDKFKNRLGFWTKDRKAITALANVRAQTFSAIELGGLDEVLPSWMRGRWKLTRAQTALLVAVVKAYRFKAGGVMEREPVLASDLGISERALRYALNGRRYTVADGTERWSPGLVERGLVSRRQLKRPGTDGRRTDDDVLLLRLGPIAEALVRPTMAAAPWIEATERQRTRAKRHLTKLRRQGRAMRRALATQAWERRQQWRSINSAAHCADNPASPPEQGGRGRLGLTRGERHSPSPSPRTPQQRKPPPDKRLTQRPPQDEARRKASRPAALPKPTAGDIDLRPTASAGRRRHAVDGEALAEAGARPIHYPTAKAGGAELEIWRRRRSAGARVPEEISTRLFADDCSRAFTALFGRPPQADSEPAQARGSPTPSGTGSAAPGAELGRSSDALDPGSTGRGPPAPD